MTFFRIPHLKATVGFLTLVGLSLAITPSQGDAQYFGRNKVQYETFDFRTMRSEHFDVHYYSNFAGPASDATRMLERWYGRLSDVFGHRFERSPIILYADHADFQQTNVIGGLLSQGTGGVTESLRNRMVLPLTGVYRENDHVLGHELVHVFQYDMAQEGGGNSFQNLVRLPLWVIEGLAEYLTAGRDDPHTAMWMRDAVMRDDLPTFRDLSRNPDYFPYRYGQAAWAYIGGRFGDRRAITLYKGAARIGDFESAVSQILGSSADSISAEWHTALKAHYEPLMANRTDPAATGKPLVTDKDRNALNVSPTVSPDGKHVAFYSQRGLFTVDLFVADAATGDVLTTLASPSRGGHFDDLSFISSAGAWSPDSRQFAFIVFKEGNNEIHVLNMDNRRVARELKPAGIGAITGMAWSPDGARLAIAGITGGVSNIYTINVDGSGLVKLTDDRWAAIHPTWSPDGRHIAFATDQGPGANIDNLAPAPMRIALLDVATRATTIVPGFAGAKNINPQFSPDGASIYFVSDEGGFSDIFRVNLASGEIRRVTNVKTGVSGITALSPALSVSQGTGLLVFSVFSRSGTNLHSLEASETTGSAVPAPTVEQAAGGILPPLRSDVVSGYLADNTTFLTAETTFPEVNYSPRLSLEYLGEPTVGFASSNYGSGFFGSVAAYFGDMLGNRTVGVAVTAEGDVRDYGVQSFYLNQGNRLNWGIAGGRVPYLSGYTLRTDTIIGGTQVPAIDQVIQRANNLQGSIMSQYPLSSTKRLELDVGYNSINFSSERLRWLDFGGFVEGPYRSDLASEQGLSYGQASAAFVSDNSYFGFTSPVLGTRYRLQVSPTFGGLNMQTVLADGRRYFLARPVTFAFRAMHFGRYGSDGESSRLNPLYVGNDQFVRGYNIYSFTADDCSAGSSSSTGCPEFDRLVGSRIAIAGAEVRVPLFGSRGYGLISSSFIPVELAAFADAGMAWTEGESVDLRFDRATTDRVPVFSAGMAARINLFGYAVAEVFYARPFQRISRSGVWGLQFAPGW